MHKVPSYGGLVSFPVISNHASPNVSSKNHFNVIINVILSLQTMQIPKAATVRALSPYLSVFLQ
jgi:hypothetical protein